MNNQMPNWDAGDPAGSLLRVAGFLRGSARQMFLDAGTHVEILFLLADDGTIQPVPIGPPLTRESIAETLREQIPDSNVYGLIHISEGWVYVSEGPGDHTMKQLTLGEMNVSDLKDDDKKEVLMVAMISRDGESTVWMDEIIRSDKGPVQLGQGMCHPNMKFPIGNPFAKHG